LWFAATKFEVVQARQAIAIQCELKIKITMATLTGDYKNAVQKKLEDRQPVSFGKRSGGIC
jgi:hypothetical protein